MGRWWAMGVGGLLVAGLSLWLLLVVSMRTKFRPILDAVRRMNRAFSNPRVMKMAGRPGASAAVIHHVGRSTGTSYATPVGVLRTNGNRLVIALPYGPRVDWLANMMAAGSGVMDHEGRTFRVERPEVVPAASVDRYLSTKDRLVHRLYGVGDFLVLQRIGTDITAGGHA